MPFYGSLAGGLVRKMGNSELSQMKAERQVASQPAGVDRQAKDRDYLDEEEASTETKIMLTLM